jgi:hypothetical protein
MLIFNNSNYSIYFIIINSKINFKFIIYKNLLFIMNFKENKHKISGLIFFVIINKIIIIFLIIIIILIILIIQKIIFTSIFKIKNC